MPRLHALDQNLSSQAIAAGYHVFNVYDIIDTVPNNGQYDAYNSMNYVDSVHPTQAANKLIGDAFAKYIAALNSKGIYSRLLTLVQCLSDYFR